MARTQKATPAPPLPFTKPMECLLVSKLPDGPEWVYELKLDGYRAQAIRDAGKVQSESLRTVLRATLKAIGLDEEDQVELGKTRNFLTNPLVAQHLREGSPIPKDGLVEALLAEDVETIAQLLLAYKERDPTIVQDLSEMALTLLELCELDSFNLPGMDEKRTLFRLSSVSR
jgi:hypothetical protein